MRLPLRISAALLAGALLYAGPAAADEPLLGGLAPLALGESGGKPVLLSDYRGRIVVVTFWNASCAPCRTQMAAFEDLNKELSAQGVQVIGVDVGDSAREYGSLLKKVRHPTMVLAHDESPAVGQAWGVFMLPNVWVVDGEGRLAMHREGFVDADLPAIFDRVRAFAAARREPAAEPAPAPAQP